MPMTPRTPRTPRTERVRAKAKRRGYFLVEHWQKGPPDGPPYEVVTYNLLLKPTGNQNPRVLRFETCVTLDEIDRYLDV
jgi:hypothetical protein